MRLGMGRKAQAAAMAHAIARLCNAADRTMPRLQDRVEIVNTLLGMTLKELQREDVDAHMQRSHGQREVLVRAVVAGNA